MSFLGKTQQAYDAEQAKIAANEAAYTMLMQEIAELQSSLDAAKETINTECGMLLRNSWCNLQTFKMPSMPYRARLTRSMQIVS